MLDNNLTINKASTPGHLSVFPTAKDTPFNLHYATNKAQDVLRYTLAANGKFIVLNDASSFPNSGIIKITSSTSKDLLGISEVIFYGKKVGDQLHLLKRGYSNTAPNTWPTGSKVTCPLMAEHHNAIKDAIIQIQKKIGLRENPSADSINGILNYLENRWMAPKPVFKGYPRMGATPLIVTFHNFSIGHGGRYLWDFGDGSTSSEQNPIHTYTTEGKFTVRLTMTSINNGQGLTEKSDYIEVNNEQLPSFFYVSPLQGGIDTEFSFVDQSDGDIVERHWFFGDGTDLTISNPNIHNITHKYSKAGSYSPSLIVRLADSRIKKVALPEGIDVI
ncbi:MAG: PKD domain-containing protein [Candidatus Dadabacteria bacterium]|nr:PKD domain-containing protein [Candidatus Dadabacteria bacterium]